MVIKKEFILLAFSFLLSLTLVIQALIAGSEARIFLPVFFVVGTGLGLLRIVVNNSIKKMKGKSFIVKFAFFAVLLGIGIPFQSWFRVNVLFAMDSAILPRSIGILVLGVLFLTFLFSFLKKKKQVQLN
ncbi:hypothetical protein [Carnobacterium jeotgali]|uniref:hypothetical protein n=1 Tax=Carnobacterium jeotgali TaxID=545534 RepID=UPI00388E3A0E